jgi:hypothetical protein
VERSLDLRTWTPWITNVLATNASPLLPGAVMGDNHQFFRIRREF